MNGRIQPIFLDVKPRYSVGEYKNSNNTVNSAKKDPKIYGYNHHLSSDVIFRSIRPVYAFLKALGVFPINIKTRAPARFKPFTAAFAYSFCVFAVILVYVVYVAYTRIGIINSLESRFEEAVIAYLFLVNILPVFIIPIMWAEAEKIVSVFNAWKDFEMLYYKVSSRPLPLELWSKALLLAIILPIISIISVIVTHFTMAEFKLIQVIPYCLLDNLTVMLGAFWYLICEALSETAFILAENFQKALKHIGPAVIIADYRALWLRLSKLTKAVGVGLCYSLTYLNLYLFFIITLSVYGLMSQMSAGFGVKDIGLAVTAISNTCLLFFICDEAHNASQHVKTNFQKKLLMVELSWMNSDAQTEINMFLRATEMNPSNINCGGFFDVNRSLFKSLITTMVTYLVVLLQFQISIPGDKSMTLNGTREMDMLNNF